jgi:DNA-binding transcriptional ArsR family regulator
MVEKKGKKDGGAKAEPAEVFTLTDLEQVKVLADPLRVRILERFATGEFTTKQVAESLGEKPTRLYRHVEALERVGLIRLTRTRQNRGTIEKYFVAVARRFRADTGLFRAGTDDEKADTLSDVVTTMMDSTADDLRRLIHGGHDLGSGEDAVLSYTEIRGTESEIDEIREKLLAFLKEIESKCCDGDPPEDARRYRLTMAYFPLDPGPATDRDED